MNLYLSYGVKEETNIRSIHLKETKGQSFVVQPSPIVARANPTLVARVESERVQVEAILAYVKKLTGCDKENYIILLTSNDKLSLCKL
ncbi:hypothetical protein ACLOJK_018293 [Asimina triloba]